MILRVVFCVAGLMEPVHAAEPRFVDRSPALPQPEQIYDGGWTHFVGGGTAVFDCNGDGFAEIFAAGGSNPARLFINETATRGGDLRFREGVLAPLTDVTGAYPTDIDSDGNLDLVVLRVGANLLLKGDGACGFYDASNEWGFQAVDAWSTAFSATWEGTAAWPTLAIGNYVDRSNPKGPFGVCDANLLYRPEGSGYGAPLELTPSYCTLSMLFTDWDRRGRADLRVSNDRQYYLRGGSEQMWRMDGPRLLGPEDGWRKQSIWGMGIASEDLNGDLRPDVMLTSMGDQMLQFAGEGAAFVDAPYAMGATATTPHVGGDGRPSTGWHAQFGDVDNDGLADIFIAKGNVDQMPENAMHDPNNLLMQGQDGHFHEASVSAGVASMARGRGAALFDLNRDGLLDLVVVNRRAPMELWLNVTKDAGGWLEVTPRQTGSNGFAVGGWVELRTAKGVRTHEITVGGGHAGGQAGPVHFGLGDTGSADVRVIWPDGAASDWVSLEAGRDVALWRDGAGLKLSDQ